MNDLEQNRIQRLENQVNILTAQLIQTNRDLARIHVLIGVMNEDNSIEWKRMGNAIFGRIEALETLKPRST